MISFSRTNTLALFLAALITGLLFPPSAQASPGRPRNIVWIIADDLAAYMVGAYGNTIARTPNIDQFARQGLRFTRAYTNAPVCTPSRQSFLTGRYPRTVGVTQLRTALPESEDTLAELLRAAGYHTVAIGKMHFNSDLMHGFHVRIDHPQHKAHLKKVGATPLPEGVAVQPPWKPFKDPASVWLNSANRPFGAVEKDMAATYFTNQAVDYLRSRPKGFEEKPFFLIVSFYEPHSPFNYPVEYRGRFDPARMPVPKVGPEDDWQIPKIFRPLTDQQKQGIIAAYHTSTAFLDHCVGRVLQALREAGLENDTLVIFFSDHGYMLGQHGRFEKHCFWEEAIRVPLIVRWPGRVPARRTSEAFVELLDLAPTCLEYAGVKVPAKIQGRSFLPLLTGQANRHKERIFIEYAENEEGMIVEGKWRFMYGTGKRQRQDGYETGLPSSGRKIRLYDLERDPEQKTDLAGRPEHAQRVVDYTRQLAEHVRRTARQPELVPVSDDPHLVLEHCLQPRDVGR